jgi:hypothetical protein
MHDHMIWSISNGLSKKCHRNTYGALDRSFTRVEHTSGMDLMHACPSWDKTPLARDRFLNNANFMTEKAFNNTLGLGLLPVTNVKNLLDVQSCKQKPDSYTICQAVQIHVSVTLSSRPKTLSARFKDTNWPLYVALVGETRLFLSSATVTLVQ